MILKKIRMHKTPLLRIWKIHIRCHRPRKRIEMMDQKKKNSTYRNNESHMERSLLRDHLIAEQMLHTSAWQYVSKTSQTCRRDTRWAPQCEKKEIIPSKKRPMSLRVRSAISNLLCHFDAGEILPSHGLQSKNWLHQTSEQDVSLCSTWRNYSITESSLCHFEFALSFRICSVISTQEKSCSFRIDSTEQDVSLCSTWRNCSITVNFPCHFDAGEILLFPENISNTLSLNESYVKYTLRRLHSHESMTYGILYWHDE